MRGVFISFLVLLGHILFFYQPIYAAAPSSFELTKIPLSVDSFSGSATTAIPIAVPPGRKGIEPNIIFSYSSSARNGIAGVGWNLELGSIYRSIKKGVPKYDNTDSFIIFTNTGAEDLVFDQALNYYRARHEKDFSKIEKLADKWVLTDRRGTKYYFGQTAASREVDPSSTSKIFRWGLDRVEDISGNYMTIRYALDGNKLFPLDIQYTGNSKTSLAPYAKVTFETILQADPLINYSAGFEMKTFRKISAVNVYGGNNLIKKYKLNLGPSPVTGRSLLKEVQEFGSDGVSTLPSFKMGYEANPVSYEVIESNTGPGDNLWNHRESGGFDHEGSNFGPVYVTQFGVSWGPTYTQPSGNLPVTNWQTTSGGRLSFTAQKDSAIYFYTYLFSTQDKTINVPWSNNGGEIGIWLNGNYQGTNRNWSLLKGYNLIEITAYDQSSTFSFNLGTDLNTLVSRVNSSPAFSSQIAADFNGDGFTDLANFNQVDGTLKIALSSGETFLPEQTWISGFSTSYLNILLLGDFNGDGKTDVASVYRPNGDIRVALSDGTKFLDQGLWAQGFGNEHHDYYSGDFNGDGLSDVMKRYPATDGSHNINMRFAFNTGASFVFSGGNNPEFSVSPDYLDTSFVDVNGDGLTDIVGHSMANGIWKIYLNTGNTSNRFTLATSATINNENFGPFVRPVIGDFNQDGFVDVGYYDYPRGVIVARMFNGSSLGPDQDLPLQFSLTTSTYIQLTDFNGDGLMDIMAYNDVGEVETARAISQTPADLMIQTQNDLGGRTSLEYSPSTMVPNTRIPFSIPVVKKLTIQNGAESYATTYDYSDGGWDVSERDFMGFGMVRARDPKGNYVETNYLQDPIQKGFVSKQVSYDASNKLLGQVRYSLDYKQLAPNCHFVFYTRRDNYTYDGVGKRTAEQYFYDENPQYGNMTKTISFGEVDLSTGNDIGTDAQIVESQYFNNPAKMLLGLPALIVSKDQSGTAMQKVWFSYDNGSNSTLPTTGLLTKKEEWDQRAVVNPITSYSYDSYGNLLTTTDSKNNVTTMTYDNQCKLFLLKTKNSKGHEVTSEYYGVDSVALDSGDGFKGIWGGLKSTTDPNNQKGKQVYDTFGRVIKAVSPLDNITYPTSTVDYQINPSFLKKTVCHRRQHNQAATINVYEFYDGLGRLIQSKSPTETAGQYAVSGQTVYDERGLPIKKYLPFFSVNPVDTIEVIDDNRPHTIFQYDLQGRLVKSINPDGAYSTVQYDDWMTTTINENGHKQVSVFDAFGHLVEKREYKGADGRSPFYPASSFSLYASTKYTYDLNGNLIKTEDAQGNVTTIVYDNMGRKIAMNDPDMGHWTYSYDANGNLISQTDAKGQTIDFTYDNLNRLISKSDHASLNVNYTYDDTTVSNSKGRLTKSAYGSENANFIYDPMGAETRSTKMIGTKQFQVDRVYDALSGLNQVKYPDSKNTFYKYNAAGLIEALSNDQTLMTN